MPAIELTDSSPGSGAHALRRRGSLRKDIAGFLLLASVSLIAGLAINQVRHQPLPLVYRTREERLRNAVSRLAVRNAPEQVPVPALAPREIGLEEFQAFVARRGIVVDARASYFYGEGHVPGALNLSRSNFEADYARAAGSLVSHKAGPVAVYCESEDCRDAHLVADALQALGYRELLVYQEGWEEWSRSGLPQEK